MKNYLEILVPLPLVFLLLGLFFLLTTTGLLSLEKWWPIIVIIIGFMIYFNYLIQYKRTKNEKSSLPKNTVSIPDNSEIEKIEWRLFVDVRNDLLRYFKQYSIFLMVIISVMGFFGIKSYINSIFTPIIVQSKILEKKYKDYNDRLDQGLNKLDVGLSKISNFKLKVDSLENKILNAASIGKALKDTTELVRRTMQKERELNDKRISSLNSLLQQISKERTEAKRAFDQYKQTISEIENEKKIYEENSDYTIIIKYSSDNESRASKFKDFLFNRGYNIRLEKLTDIQVPFLRKYSKRITYNGIKKISNKASVIIQQLNLSDFSVYKDATHQKSNFLLTIWLID